MHKATPSSVADYSAESCKNHVHIGKKHFFEKKLNGYILLLPTKSGKLTRYVIIRLKKLLQVFPIGKRPWIYLQIPATSYQLCFNNG